MKILKLKAWNCSTPPPWLAIEFFRSPPPPVGFEVENFSEPPSQPNNFSRAPLSGVIQFSDPLPPPSISSSLPPCHSK